MSLVRADLLKLRKRPMGWVMLLIVALFVPLLMLPSAFLSPGNANYAFPGGVLEGLTPLPFVGTFLLIVLGATLVGTEYSYDTWKNLLTRHPGRTPFILSKWSMLVVATGVGLLVLLPLGQLFGWLADAALHLSGPSVSVSFGNALLLILLQTLLPLIAGSIALMGAVIGRSSVTGIVVGIAWFLVDALLGGVLPQASLSSSLGALQAQITGVALSSDGSIAQVHAGGALAGPLWIVQALLVAAYLVIPIAIAAFLFRRRDMLGVG